MAIHPVFVQAFYYGLVLFGTLALAGAFQRGFFWKYSKVRVSFGKLLMVKIRTPLRDYFAIGEVIEGFLVYKLHKEKVRYSINSDDKVFYRALAVTWIDVDEEKHGLVRTDFSTVSAFDAPKFESLNVRALMKPAERTLKEKIIIFLLGLILLGTIIAIFMCIKNASAVNTLATSIPGWLESMRGAVNPVAGVV